MQTSIERDADISDLLHLLPRPMEDYDRDFRYLAAHDEELLAEYPNEWVAIFECKLVAHNPDSSELEQQIERAGLNDKSPVVDFLFGREVRLIL